MLMILVIMFLELQTPAIQSFLMLKTQKLLYLKILLEMEIKQQKFHPKVSLGWKKLDLEWIFL